MAQGRTKKLGQPKQGKLGKATAPKGSLGSKKLGAGGLKKGTKKVPNKGKALNRAVASLAAVIRALRTEDGSESVDTRVEIGQHLADARKMLPHGQWMQFLTEEVGYPFRTAQRLIQLKIWASHNKQMMRQVRGWGPTKVYHVMDAGPAVAKRLLSRKQFVMGSGRRKTLGMLTSVELKGVLDVMAGAVPAPQQPEEEPDEGAELRRKMQRDSSKVMRWVNELATLQEPLVEEDEREEVARVYKRLLRSARKLETMLDEIG